MGSIDQPSETCTLLETHQITSIGNFFVSSLCVVKHNGATRKLQLAFEQVCSRMLVQQSKDLSSLPHSWLIRVIDNSQRPGQGRTDIVRRSSGIPLAISAICTAECSTASQCLLPLALQILLDSVRSSEEPWPKVHAFNCLRIIFETAALIKGAAVSLEDAVRASIEGIAEQEWEVCCQYCHHVKLHRTAQSSAVQYNATNQSLEHRVLRIKCQRISFELLFADKIMHHHINHALSCVSKQCVHATHVDARHAQSVTNHSTVLLIDISESDPPSAGKECSNISICYPSGTPIGLEEQ